MKGTAVIVETRPLKNIKEIVLNHKEYSGFDILFFHGTENYDWVSGELNGIEGISFFNLGIKEIDANWYNRILTSKFFWNAIKTDKVLVFQHDSWMLRKGIEEFYPYNFCGALIYHMEYPCQNGGLSLRDKSKMLEVIDKVPYDGRTNEDIYFTRGLQHIGGILPSKEVCMKFSVETIAGTGSLGYHCIDRYLSQEICNYIKNQYK